MKIRIKFILTGLAIFILIIFFEIYYSDKSWESGCEKVLSKYYACIVEKKEKILKDHGNIRIHCRDFKKDSTFTFYPEYTYNPEFFYIHAEVGDTLVKNAGSNIFWILKTEKKDSFIFECK